MALSDDIISRYTRQIVLSEIGETGQQQLTQARVLVIGAGGLGSPLLAYLAGAGIGTIGIVDADHVSISNLQRQMIYQTQQNGLSKTTAATQYLQALNPMVRVHSYPVFLTRDNAEEMIASYDIVADGSDNFETKYLINDVCYALKKPFVQASVFQFQGQCAFFTPQTPCYRCLFPSLPHEAPNCEAAGILGVVPGMMGLIQANEILKYLLNIPETLIGKNLQMDFKSYRVQIFQRTIEPLCLTCQQKLPLRQLPAMSNFCQTAPRITATQLKQWQATEKPHRLIDVRETAEFARISLPNSINLPLSSLDKNIALFDQPVTTVIVCQQGIRSAQAASRVKIQYPHADVFSLEGGINVF